MSQGSPQNVYHYFMNDKTDYHAFIGNSRASTSPDIWEQNLQGFIYNFHLYQVKYTLATDQYATGLGCFDGPQTASCWTVSFNTYSNTNGIAPEIPCDGTCDTRGCRDGNACTLEYTGSGGIVHCNLCYDHECASCSTYDDICSVCNVSGNAYVSSTDCICNIGYGRVNDQSLCTGVKGERQSLVQGDKGRNRRKLQVCWTNCKSCDVNAEEHYNACTACRDDTFDTTPSPNDVPGYSFCSANCPSLWTCNTGVSPYTATPPGSFELYAYYFAYAFPDARNQWANEVSGQETRSASLHDNSPAGIVASYRGIYFDGIPAWVVLESSLVLNHDFSVYVWTYHQSISGQRVIFAKDRNPNLFIRFYTDDAVVKVDVAKDDDHTVSSTVDTTGQGGDINLMSWAFVGFSAQLQLHKDTEINIYKDAGLLYTATITEIFVDDQAAWGASIGIERSGASTWDQNPFMGFIVEFHLWQASIDGRSEHRATSGCGNSCSECPSAHLEGICVWDTSSPDDLFGKFYNQET